VKGDANLVGVVIAIAVTAIGIAMMAELGVPDELWEPLSRVGEEDDFLPLQNFSSPWFLHIPNRHPRCIVEMDTASLTP
jgi:hypothetical protein